LYTILIEQISHVIAILLCGRDELKFGWRISSRVWFSYT